MKTTELFNFRFVNRKKEQGILKAYFNNMSETTLWINGNRGLGKTTFFNYAFDNDIPYSLCYVNIKADSSSVDIISDLILELQKNCDVNFFSMIEKKYKRFYNGIYKNTKEISNILFPQISSIVSVLLDFNYSVITINEERRNSIEIILDYIRNILKNKRICVCIDNFSRCDIETANIFFQIFKTFFNEEYFRSCIITTSEELQAELMEAIQRKLPYTEIKIKELDEYIYFGQILDPIYELKAFEREDIEYIYYKCEGSPKKLATVISKLLEKNGISVYPTSKARIDKKTLFSILQSEHIHFKEDDFDAKKKWVLFSYICLTEEIDYISLEKLALYIAKKFFLFESYDKQLFKDELLCLIDRNILRINNCSMVTTCYDDDYVELLDIFHNSQLKGIFSQYAYEFIMQQCDFPQKQRLLCRHAREANITGWEHMNFRYGKLLSKKKQFYDAQKIFSSLNDYFNKIHVMKKLYIAINSYETGNYQLTINQLETFDPEKLHFSKAHFYYLLYMGKSYYNIGNTEKGAMLLERALKDIPTDSIEYVYTLNVLHMYYFEIPEKIETSKEIFQKIKDRYEMEYPIAWANTMRGCHNFLENKEALEVLKKAENILDDELEKAFVNTTRGFVYIKENQNELAQECFKDACSAIKRIKIHEYSYAANNLAICYMLNGNYQNAKDVLLEAMLWNRTDYGNVVIQVHLMICTLYLGQKDEACEYFDFLQKYMANAVQKDQIRNRKVYLNLAIACNRLNRPQQEKSFLLKAEKYVKNTSSEWRYYVLSGQEESCSVSRPTAKYQNIKDFDPWFLVYAHD